jgi:IS30 family transposase
MGLNEDTDGLIRQYLPKNINFVDVNDEQIKRVEILLSILIVRFMVKRWFI